MKNPKTWFLPRDTDPLRGLREQMNVTVEGMAAFEAWALGDPGAAEVVRAAEHAADAAKHEVRTAVREAFITPISAEDIFILSGNLDKILNWAKDAVREAEVMAMAPDAAMGEMASRLHEGVRHLSVAFDAIGTNGNGDGGRAATEAADEATRSARKIEKIYRSAMSDLLTLEDDRLDLVGIELEHIPGIYRDVVRELIGRRELYRRMSRIAEALVGVADRVWYASVKEI